MTTFQQTINDDLQGRDSLQYSNTTTLTTFEGPTVEEGPAGGDSLFYYFRLTRGITVVQRGDGSWGTARYLSQEDMAACLKVYRGGYKYVLSPAEASALITAGFETYVQPPVPHVITVPENP